MATNIETKIQRIEDAVSEQTDLISQITAALAGKAPTTFETWVFELEDGTTVEKEVALE